MEERTGTILGTRLIHSGRVFDIVSDRVRLPNGHETTMDVVRHQPSVILIPMLDIEKVVLVRQFRYSINRWIWELPAGTLEPGEHVEAAARRECEEETGYAAGRVERLGAFYPTPGYCDELMHFFRLTDLTTPPVRAPRDEDEGLEPAVYLLDDARRLVSTDDATDMKTVLGLSLAAR